MGIAKLTFMWHKNDRIVVFILKQSFSKMQKPLVSDPDN